MKLAGVLLALALASCTEVIRTSLPNPPAPEEILGRYSVSWSDGALLGAAVLAGNGVCGFAPYPCAVTEEIRGSYEYGAGELHVEAKSLEGSARLCLRATFSDADEAHGEYEVLLLGAQCSRGPVELRRTE